MSPWLARISAAPPSDWGPNCVRCTTAEAVDQVFQRYW